MFILDQEFYFPAYNNIFHKKLKFNNVFYFLLSFPFEEYPA